MVTAIWSTFRITQLLRWIALKHGLLTCESYGGKKRLTITEIVTKGARLSPFEDFRQRTLSAISGLWAKLLYMAQLRSDDGSYQHWGHMRAHGEAQSQYSLGKAHSEIWLQVLRTPLNDLLTEAHADDSLMKKVLSANQTNRTNLIPKDLEGGSRRHFNSIVLAVHLLAVDRHASRHSTASPLQPPVQ
jgi:hypothetical protein